MECIKGEPDLLQALVDPFCLAGGFRGPEQPADNKPYEDELLGQWVTPFIMATINSKNIHRSNALMGHPYGEDFRYDEMMLTGPGEQGKAAAEYVAKADPLGGVGDRAQSFARLYRDVVVESSVIAIKKTHITDGFDLPRGWQQA